MPSTCGMFFLGAKMSSEQVLQEIARTLGQIRDELRELNGKDAEGNRWLDPNSKTYLLEYNWDRANGQYVVNDHQGETPPFMD